MAAPNRRHLSDFRGAARMAFDATAGITNIVEKMHRTIQLRPGPIGDSADDRPRGITGLVYRMVEGGMRTIGKGLDWSLAPIAALLPEGESTPSRDAFLSALNGVCGDYLLRTDNPLTIEMSLRYCGRPVDLEDPARTFGQDSDVAATSRLLVLVHGLCRNDRQWTRNGHDHGAALADELGYAPLYLRYNSGLHVERNGLGLAEMLESLVKSWYQPVEELVIIGHSMGGLVARSACEHGRESGHAWPRYLHKLVFLGTPHHGAPLERGGHWLDRVMEWSPYSAPFTRIGKLRSAGITDLRYGSITTEANEPVPLPTGVKCYAAAATLGARRGVLSERLLGDGLVPLDSALGRHSDTARTLAIPKSRQWIGYQMRHFELLHRPEVYAQLHTWLQETA